MEKPTFWAILGFLSMGIILSFSSMGIFLTKYDQDKEALIYKKAVLTDANALSWGATPGYKDVKEINTFQFFTHRSGIIFDVAKESSKYSYVSELSNRTYVPSSLGFIKFFPKFKFEKISDQTSDITNLNIAAIQYFYKSLNQPAFAKLPRYLNMIFQGLSQDFMNYYFTHTIYDFYTSDQKLVYDTIFTPAKISKETQDKMWNDEQYGWNSETSFSKWIRAYFNGGDSKLQLYFSLSDEQMNQLIGQGSTINKLRKLIINSVSTGVQGQQKGSCLKKNECTLWELGVIQWAFGGLTAKDFVPPVTFSGGSYSKFNDSIPKSYEFYIDGSEYQYDDVKNNIGQNFEQMPNLLGFNTMQYIWENKDHLERVSNKLNWQNDNATNYTKSTNLIKYLNTQFDYINNIEDTYAFQTWRFMSKMIYEAGIMLRDGLYAKALYYRFENIKCADDYFIPFQDACDSKYDFTINPKNALIWVNAAFEKKQSDSFKTLMKDLKANEQVLWDYLTDGMSDFSKAMNEFHLAISKYYKCTYQICQAEELWYKQWGNSSVTQNYPKELAFWDTDKTITISKWDIYADKPFVHYEFYSFCGEKITEKIQQQLFNFDMGGIFGYYSLRNLYEHHFNSTKVLSPKFPLKGEQLKLLIKYLKHCLTNYWYGGHMITTQQSKYLFDYDNTYTDKISSFEPIYEGSNFRDNGAHLLEPNNQEFLKFATMYDFYQMDTGIKDIDNVGQVVRTLDESKIKRKRVIYYNPQTEYSTQYYNYPYGKDINVTGGYGYAFQPDLIANFQKQLDLFDFDIHKNLKLNYHETNTYKGYDVIKYKVESQMISLEPYTDLPIFLTIGYQSIDGCVQINGSSCNQYMAHVPESSYIIEAITGKVVSFTKTFIYWLKIDNKSPLQQEPFNDEIIVPILQRSITYDFTEDQMNEHFQDVKDLQKHKDTIFYVTLTFGLIFCLAFIGFIIYFRKNEPNIHSRAPSVYSVVAEE
ncbi:unnamed protein product [Paramecium pentaurelia]|uniref:Uncharacterized protein n=1 Tax=Paramecium pentaurelia TaxID=43138 RepID=A0A8S1UTI1_9CILI|nr:unnamed protein product [Paramecium pentaurelia]